jgi:hypothetical protein
MLDGLQRPEKARSPLGGPLPARTPGGRAEEVIGIGNRDDHEASVVPGGAEVALGFALEEIGELLDLRVEDEAAGDAVEARTRAKLADVRGRIEALRRLEAVLEDLTASCRSRTPTDECPVLDTLSEAGTGMRSPILASVGG